MFRLCAVIILVGLLSASAAEKPKPAANSSIHLDREGDRWAEKTLRKMTLEEKVGQLFMVWVRAGFLNTESADYQQLIDQMHKYHVGSFAMTVRWEPPFLYRTQPFEAADLLNRLQRESKLPLLIAADFERGVTMRVNGATEFPTRWHLARLGKRSPPKSLAASPLKSRALSAYIGIFFLTLM